jgi:hypothetical protein
LRDGEFYILYHGKRGISVIPRQALEQISIHYFLAAASLPLP